MLTDRLTPDFIICAVRQSSWNLLEISGNQLWWFPTGFRIFYQYNFFSVIFLLIRGRFPEVSGGFQRFPDNPSLTDYKVDWRSQKLYSIIENHLSAWHTHVWISESHAKVSLKNSLNTSKMAEVQQDEEKDKIPEVISFIMAKKMKWQNIPICKMWQIFFCNFANISSNVFL